jgi:negative elongation factor A
MLEAQEMFRTANKVTRPEKALILGFMAGSRGEYATLYHILT